MKTTFTCVTHDISEPSEVEEVKEQINDILNIETRLTFEVTAAIEVPEGVEVHTTTPEGNNGADDDDGLDEDGAEEGPQD